MGASDSFDASINSSYLACRIDSADILSEDGDDDKPSHCWDAMTPRCRRREGLWNAERTWTLIVNTKIASNKLLEYEATVLISYEIPIPQLPFSFKLFQQKINMLPGAGCLLSAFFIAFREKSCQEGSRTGLDGWMDG
jgi:hypothetical protein